VTLVSNGRESELLCSMLELAFGDSREEQHRDAAYHKLPENGAHSPSASVRAAALRNEAGGFCS
jgi:hypothetical protein